jgi:hypothetical protein
VAQHL